MRTLWLLLPAALSALVLGAHYLRRGAVAEVVACLGLLALLFVRRPWARWASRAALALGSLEWLRTLWVLVGERRTEGRPWGRLLVILGPVALLALVAVMALGTTGARRWFTRPPADPGS